MNIDNLVPKFNKSPLSNLYHICTLPNGKDIKLSQFTSWLRKNKAIRYYAVRGMQNGIHFHALVEMKDRNVSRFTKAKTTVIPLSTPQERFIPEQWEIQEAELKSQEIEYHRYQKALSTEYGLLHLWCQLHIKKISKRAAGRLARSKAKTKKEFHVGGVLRYLQKNLHENELPHYEYDHFASTNLN